MLSSAVTVLPPRLPFAASSAFGLWRWRFRADGINTGQHIGLLLRCACGSARARLATLPKSRHLRYRRFQRGTIPGDRWRHCCTRVHASADLDNIFRFGDTLFILCEQFADANRRMPVNGAIDRVIERQVARRGGAERQLSGGPSSERKHLVVTLIPSDVIVAALLLRPGAE